MTLLNKEPVKRAEKSLRRFDQKMSVITLDSSARTAMEAASSLGCEAGAIVKSLLFKTDNTFTLCLIAGDKKASLYKIKKTLKISDASMASADEVKRAVEQQEAGKKKKTKDKTDDLIKQMEPKLSLDNVKLDLCNVFVESNQWTGAQLHQRTEMIENLTREDTTDMEEFDIKDFAIAHPDNKQKLKKFCEDNMEAWKGMAESDYKELVAFMSYLNKKFQKEDV